jgi:uncharacterized protein DUF6307
MRRQLISSMVRGGLHPTQLPSLRDSTVPDSGCELPTLTRGTVMAVETVYISHYDRRVRLVADALTQNSKLTDEAALELAKHVLNALDHIPEKIR